MTDPVDVQVIPLCGHRRVARGEAVDLEGVLQLPADAAPSFHLPYWLRPFHAGWRCEASVQLQDGKERTKLRLLEVTP